MRLAAARHHDIKPDKIAEIEKDLLRDEEARRLGTVSNNASEVAARVLALENERDGTTLLNHHVSQIDADPKKNYSIIW